MTDNVEDHYLVEQIRQALATDERVNELGLTVVVSDEQVVVTGAVSTPQRKSAIPDVIEQLASGYTVADRTTVVSDDEAEQVEEL